MGEIEMGGHQRGRPAGGLIAGGQRYGRKAKQCAIGRQGGMQTGHESARNRPGIHKQSQESTGNPWNNRTHTTRPDRLVRDLDPPLGHPPGPYKQTVPSRRGTSRETGCWRPPVH